MNLRAHLRVVGGLLCGVAAASYLLSDVLFAAEGLLFTLAIAAGYLLPAGARRIVPDLLWTALLLCLLGFEGVRTWLAPGNVMFHLFEFVRWLLVAKVWARKSGRDELQILLLSFFVLLGGTVFTFSSAIAPLLMIYVVLAPIGLYLASAAATQSEEELAAGGPFIPLRIYRLAVLSGILIFLGGGIIFFSLPRLSAAIVEFNFSSGEPNLFPLGVDLRSQGMLRPGPRVMFRARADPPLEYVPLWRVQALDRFDGTRWSGTRLERAPLEQPAPGIFASDPAALSTRSPAQRFEFDLSPLQLPALIVPADRALGPPDALAVRGPFTNVATTMAGDVSFERSEAKRADTLPMSYEIVYFAPGRGSVTPHFWMSESARRDLTALPVLLSPEVERLARELARRADAAGEGARDLARMATVERYLNENYTYSLERSAASSPDPVASFLFEEKAGHCEFFASAAAVLLRAQGIPARVVTGFASGAFDAAAGEWTVRESDAHSWVEAFDEERGWLSIDPSPRDLDAEHGRISPLLLAWQDMKQKTELWWYDWVLRYSLAEQMGLVSTVASKIPQVTGGGETSVLPSFSKRLPPAQVMWAIGTFVVGAGLLLGLGLLRARGRGTSAGPSSALARLLVPLRREARRRGIECGESRTPRELADDLAGRLDRESAAALLRWVESYNEARFAGHGADAGAGLKRNWKNVGALLKRSRSA